MALVVENMPAKAEDARDAGLSLTQCIAARFQSVFFSLFYSALIAFGYRL